jgi:16S rRNA (uracil1498-N3)-methyltransferase
MKIPRVFVSPHSITGRAVTFPRREAHYLRDVLRLVPGDQVQVLDGDRVHVVRLTRSDREEVCAEVISSRGQGDREGLDITLAFGCVRPGPFQEILRHGTELGVRRFVPVIARRTVRRPERRKERWEHVIASAASQSRRTILPLMESPVDLEGLIASKGDSQTRLVLSPDAAARPLLESLEHEHPQALLLLVGPEGGFDKSEEKRAVEQGFKRVGLGPGILRTETAAVVAVGVCVAWFHRTCFGDLRIPGH